MISNEWGIPVVYSHKDVMGMMKMLTSELY
jgi:hypothetical protein